MGTAFRCFNGGLPNAPDAENVGGVAGESRSAVRDCWAKADLTGKKSLGGIAGSAATLTGCRVMVRLHCKEGEGVGAIAGLARDLAEVENNLFVQAGGRRAWMG